MAKEIRMVCYPICGRIVRAIVEGDANDPWIRKQVKRTMDFNRGVNHHGHYY